MTEDDFRVAELLLQGFKCSHILMKLALEAQGRDDPDLVRAMSGLAVGMGGGLNCGALTGGCCVLGLCAGRGQEDEPEDPRLPAMLEDFTGWFKATAAERYGGVDCPTITQGDPAVKKERCPPLILDAWRQLQDTAGRYGVDLQAPRRPGDDTGRL